MLTKFYVVQVDAISWAFSELSFQRYFRVVDQIIHFFPSVFHEGKLSVKLFVVLLVLFIEYSNRNDHEQARIGLVANWAFDSGAGFHASEQNALIDSVLDIFEEIFGNSFVHFWVGSCRTYTIFDFVGLVSFEQNIEGQFFVDNAVLILWTRLLYFIYEHSGDDFGLSDWIGLSNDGMTKIVDKNLLFEQLIVLEQIDKR
jgi:hypothetical protein